MVPRILRKTDDSHLDEDGFQNSWEAQMIPSCSRKVPRTYERETDDSTCPRIVPTCPRMVFTCPRMVPTCPRRVSQPSWERQMNTCRWTFPVQGWFPEFLRETDSSCISFGLFPAPLRYTDGGTWPIMLPSIPERARRFPPVQGWYPALQRDRWSLSVQGWFPVFIKETDGSYLSKDGSRHFWDWQMVSTCPKMVSSITEGKYGSDMAKDGSQHSWERQMVSTCSRMIPRIPERDRWFLPVQGWFQHSWERQMVPTCAMKVSQNS